MGLLALYWGVMIAGYIVASRLRQNAGKFGFVQKAMMGTVYILVLIMGLRMGANEQVMSNLRSIGLQALVMTVFAVAGSMLAIFAVRKVFRMDRFGNQVCDNAGASEQQAEEASPETDDNPGSIRAELENNPGSSMNRDDVKSTLVILGLVAGGMLAGCFVISEMSDDIIESFDVISGHALTVFLCLLLCFVGFDLGLSGNVVANIKTVGVKACAFPFAAVAGSLILGTASGLFFGFSVREGIAISAGFGWYTYAPTVIAGAGAQYGVASAVSFMHNVIRELSGIVLIPVLAKKTGYLEVTGIPGVAAMDVCMPIVERSCRTDTVVYSFATGLLMCIATSVLVPLAMGV